MDSRQFFASIIGSLAWPAAIVLCVLMLRRELIQVLKRLRKVKYGEAEVEFGERLEEAEEEIAELPTPASQPPVGELQQQYFRAVDRFSTNGAVFVSWLEVESAILNLARANDLLTPNTPASRVAQILLQHEIIDRATFSAIRELQALRNIAVHPSDARVISKEEADRFKKLADKVAAALEDKRLALR